MARPRKPGGKGDHHRTLKKRQVTLTGELDEIVERLAREIAEPGLGPNFSEAMRKIIGEWSTGRSHDGSPIRRGRKKIRENPG